MAFGKSSDLTELDQLLGRVWSANADVQMKQRAFRTDAFVDGFIVGAVVQYGHTRPELSDKQRIRLLTQLDEKITPSWPGIFGFLQLLVQPHPRNRYQKEKNPDWDRGMVNGVK